MFLETKEVADNDTAPCSEADSQSSTECFQPSLIQRVIDS